MALLFLAAISSFSCGSKLLHDSFSGEVTSTLPPHDIPGEPIGDSLMYDPASSPRLKVIQDDTFKALAFSDETTSIQGTHADGLSFVGITTNLSKPILFSWTAKLDRGNNDLLLYLSDGYGNYISRLTLLENGEIRAATDPVDYLNFPKLIGQINFGDYHIFTVRLDPLTNTCNISVVGVGVTRVSTLDDDPRRPINVTIASLSNLVIEDRKIQVLPRPTFSLNWSPKITGHQKYSIASVSINRM